MFTQVRLDNFKSFKQAAIDLRRVNIFMGPNGAGKSSILQVLLLWAQSIGEQAIQSTGRLIDLGNPSDLVFDESLDTSIGFDGSSIVGLQAMEDEGDRRIDVKVDSGFGTAKSMAVVSGPLQLTMERSSSGQEGVDPTEFSFANATIALGPTNRLPSPFRVMSTSGDSADGNRISRDFNEIQAVPGRLLSDIRFVPSIRGFQSARYNLRASGSADLVTASSVEEGAESLAATLSYNDPLRGGVSTLMREITGVGIDRTLDEGPLAATVSTRVVRGATKLVGQTNEGFGTNQLVYLFTQLLMTPEGGTTLIEEPETALHPGAQAKLGVLLARHAVENDKQLLLTSHGEDLLGGILWAVQQGELLPSDVGVFYVAQDADGVSSVQRKDVTSGGLVQGSYEEFFAGPEGYPVARSFFPGVD